MIYDILGHGEKFKKNLIIKGVTMNNFENTEKTENARLLEQKNNVMRKNIVLFSTLKEIKEIAQCDCGFCTNFKCPRMDNILQKISEVENAR